MQDLTTKEAIFKLTSCNAQVYHKSPKMSTPGHLPNSNEKYEGKARILRLLPRSSGPHVAGGKLCLPRMVGMVAKQTVLESLALAVGSEIMFVVR